MSGRTVWHLPNSRGPKRSGWSRNCPENIVEQTMGAVFNRAGYPMWKVLQARAGKALLKVHKPEEAPIEGFDPLELDD
jgi:hypothetical protein